MAIFRGTGGAGDSTDDSIVSEVTEQAGIATTKAQEAVISADSASNSASSASGSETAASNSATAAAGSASTANTKASEAASHASDALASKNAAATSATAAADSATAANSANVQTVAGLSTEITNLNGIRTDITGVNAVRADVVTVSGISSDVTTVAADASDIGTVATNITNVNNVGDNISNVNAVHSNASNINTVAADGSDIGTVAGNISNVNTVAGISSNVTTVAGLESKMDTVIADASDIGTVAGNIGDVTTVAGISSDVDTVAGISADVTSVADNMTDVQNATISATNAAASASTASNSASAASTSAGSASSSASSASISATNASNSATAASNSATAASASKDAAASSAQLSGQAWTLASSRAYDAAASEDNAATSETNAASSATAADTSATNAATSETNAAASATDSSNAASTWSNYYNTYVGASSSAPTVDVQGNALVAGALYFNTTNNTTYVWTGSAWNAVANNNIINPNVALTQDLATNGNDVKFGDNDKATFGAGDDLQIYHDGNNKIEAVSGYLKLASALGSTYVDGNNVHIRSGDGGETLARFNDDSDVKLYHDNALKLATTSTGIDVTGTATMDGLTVDGSTTTPFTINVSSLVNGANNTKLGLLSANNSMQLYTGPLDALSFATDPNDGGGADKRLNIDDNGDISFYEDTGTTPKLFWDASAESLGIGTSSPSVPLDIKSTNSASIKWQRTGVAAKEWGFVSDNDQTYLYNFTDSVISTSFHNSGRVGIGTSSPNQLLSLNSEIAGARGISFDQSGAERIKLLYTNSTGGFVITNTTGGGYTSFENNGSERMRIDSSGNVGIGTSSPSAKLEVNGGGTLTTGGTLIVRQDGDTYSDGIALTSSNATSHRLWKDSAGKLNVGPSSLPSALVQDLSGNVGIGTSSPAAILDVAGSGAEIAIRDTRNQSFTVGDTIASLGFYSNDTSGGSGSTPNLARGSIDVVTTNTFGSIHDMVFKTRGDVSTAAAERLRIDSSGNLLVGKTSASSATVGFQAGQDGFIAATRASGQPLVLNRTTNDGIIADFRKDGTTVGSIGNATGTLVVGSTDGSGSYLRFGSNNINPTTGAGALRDAAIDLGKTGGRFKDLYLSGGVYLGGTGAANKLDDYEEGTWTPTVRDNSGNSATASTATGYYTKIGQQVHIVCEIDNIDTTGLVSGDQMRIVGLPFSAVGLTNNVQWLNVIGKNNVLTTSDTVIATVQDVFNYLRFRKAGENTGAFLAVSALTSGTADMKVDLTYFTD